VANHRAGRGETRAASSTDSSVSGSHRTDSPRAQRGGARRAVPAKPDRAAPARSDRAASAKPDRAASAKSGGSRALRSPEPPAKRKGGARKAVPAAPAGARRKLAPSVPTLAGAAVLAFAATGALTLGHAPLSDVGAGGLARLSASASFLGANDLAAGAHDRQQRPSRDATRAALQNAQDQKLVAAADAQAQQRNATLDALAASAERHADSLAWHLPVARGRYELTARFGEVSGLWMSVHTGLDFAGPVGTPIMAVAGGVITSTGWAGAYGNQTIETLPDGTEIWYCHQNGFNVQVGQHVMPGQVIGYIGSTGNTTGPHLHLEVRPGGGAPVDPYAELVAHGVQP
jgi:murein DD-endopeptidase MepM/ murein hydrolase activator NlpD